MTLTNYVFSGPIFVPIDFAADLWRIDDVTVLLNGLPTSYAELIPFNISGQIYWGVRIYFDRLTNGNYQIQLQTHLRLDEFINDDTRYVVLSNKPITIVVSNLVTFPDWEDLVVGTNYSFKANSAVSNVNWEIEIYDYNGSLINYQTGTTTNGAIEWTWDLTDLSSNTRDDLGADPFFDPVISLFQPAASGGGGSGFSYTNFMPLNALDFPTEGGWVIGYQDRVKNQNIKVDYVAAMEAIRGGPANAGIFNEKIELAYGPDAGPDAGTAQTNRNDTWDELKLYLTSRYYRNFYYQGHGNTNIIGGDYDRYDANTNLLGSQINPNGTSRAYLTPTFVRDYITFNKHGGAHPYRFVFLDGCQTAAGEWPQAWGVPKATNSLSYYTATNRPPPRTRPSAFVGWQTVIGGGPNWGFTSGYRLFRSEWMFLWSQSGNLEIQKLFKSLIQANIDSSWVAEATLAGSLRVYGYQDLKFNEYNHRNDWAH